MKKSILFFAALAALFSCSKENPVDNYNPADDTYSVTLTASAPGADTKTTLVDGEGTKFVHWSKGDAIKVLFFPHAQSNAAQKGPSGVFNTTFTEDSSQKAYFRTESWSWEGVDMSIAQNRGMFKDGIAVYPHTATAVSDKVYGYKVNSVQSEVSFLLPEIQSAVVNNIESGLNFSYSRVSLNDFVNTVYSNSTTKLSFENACAMIELTMPNSFGDKKVTSIIVKSNDDVVLTGKGFVNLANTSNVSTQNVVPDPFSMTVDGSECVELINSNGFEVGQKYNVVVWPGSHPSGLTIEFVAEDGLIATKTTSGVELTASKIKPYNFVSELEFKDPILANPPKVGDYFYSDGSYSSVLDNEKTIVGVVFFVGDPTVDDSTLRRDYPNCTHGLVVGLNAGSGKWLSANEVVYEWAVNKGYHTTQQFTYSGRLSENENSQYMWGYNNTHAIRNYAKEKGLSSGIVNFVDSYGVDVANASPWYIPSVAEMKLIRNSSLKSLVESIGGDSLSKTAYYMSAEENDAKYIPTINFSAGSYSDGGYKTSESNVCPIFAF